MSESWAERIPAAIEKAEGQTFGLTECCSDTSRRLYLTKGEVALAKALWELVLSNHDPRAVAKWSDVVLGIELEIMPGGVFAALRAFVEKVEAL